MLLECDLYQHRHNLITQNGKGDDSHEQSPFFVSNIIQMKVFLQKIYYYPIKNQEGTPI